MILEIDDWKFDVDIARTMEYSAAEAAEHCECAYCRNFYAAINDHCPELRTFLAQFGIDAEAPDALYPYDSHKDLLWYEGEYVVFGSILRFGKKPIVADASQIFLIEPLSEDRYSLPQPYFLLSFDSVEMNWLLSEPMEEVISPANEPSFLKMMWDRLLGKLNRNQWKS